MSAFQVLGLEDNVVFAGGMEDPVKAMKLEWRERGSDKDWANFQYVLPVCARGPGVRPHLYVLARPYVAALYVVVYVCPAGMCWRAGRATPSASPRT